MHREGEEVVVLAQADRHRPQQPALGQIERAVSEGLDDRPAGLLGVGGPAQVQLLDGHMPGLLHDLHRVAVRARGEPGPQHLVADHQGVEGGAQRRRVQRAAHAERRRHHVLRAPGVQLVEEPEALLREGQRNLPHPLRTAPDPYRSTRTPHSRKKACLGREFAH
ncbi:hypothetical protein [Streptomyces sp. Root66D1]|uniref:hypothetical protein n=1 Tax=Streptomyces sp. Root66D1 TaxID=1736582 RepID=UPI001F5B7E08|nr:hypothetical protein [Streptomyces sp. Root66D1]